MKFAIVSDLHANLTAFERVLKDAAECGADRVVCLGDIVGYGPLPEETLLLARKTLFLAVSGNHDDAVSGRLDAQEFIDLAQDAVERHRQQLSNESLSYLKSLPHTAEIEGAAFLVTIITDGYENASKEWDSKSVGRLIDSCKEEGWMFSFIGAGEDVVRVASKISITNTMVWENTSEGTEMMFSTENQARMRFCEDLDVEMCSYDRILSLEKKKAIFKKLADNYYDEDKK
jgi:hypothetical protein